MDALHVTQPITKSQSLINSMNKINNAQKIFINKETDIEIEMPETLESKALVTSTISLQSPYVKRNLNVQNNLYQYLPKTDKINKIIVKQILDIQKYEQQHNKNYNYSQSVQCFPKAKYHNSPKYKPAAKLSPEQLKSLVSEQRENLKVMTSKQLQKCQLNEKRFYQHQFNKSDNSSTKPKFNQLHTNTAELYELKRRNNSVKMKHREFTMSLVKNGQQQIQNTVTFSNQNNKLKTTPTQK